MTFSRLPPVVYSFSVNFDGLRLFLSYGYILFNKIEIPKARRKNNGKSMNKWEIDL